MSNNDLIDKIIGDIEKLRSDETHEKSDEREIIDWIYNMLIANRDNSEDFVNRSGRKSYKDELSHQRSVIRYMIVSLENWVHYGVRPSISPELAGRLYLGDGAFDETNN
jgi:hypothetical protein